MKKSFLIITVCIMILYVILCGNLSPRLITVKATDDPLIPPTPPVNLFNFNVMDLGYTLDENGTLFSNPTALLSGYIAVTNGWYVYNSSEVYIFAFDSSKNFLGYADYISETTPVAGYNPAAPVENDDDNGGTTEPPADNGGNNGGSTNPPYISHPVSNTTAVNAPTLCSITENISGITQKAFDGYTRVYIYENTQIAFVRAVFAISNLQPMFWATNRDIYQDAAFLATLNLCYQTDPDISYGKELLADGTMQSSEQYFVSGFLLVQEGAWYSFSGENNIIGYNNQKQYLGCATYYVYSPPDINWVNYVRPMAVSGTAINGFRLAGDNFAPLKRVFIPYNSDIRYIRLNFAITEQPIVNKGVRLYPELYNLLFPEVVQENCTIELRVTRNTANNAAMNNMFISIAYNEETFYNFRFGNFWSTNCIKNTASEIIFLVISPMAMVYYGLGSNWKNIAATISWSGTNGGTGGTVGNLSARIATQSVTEKEGTFDQVRSAEPAEPNDPEAVPSWLVVLGVIGVVFVFMFLFNLIRKFIRSLI